MDYYKFAITCPEPVSEILIALFSTQPFDMFEENEQGFDAFIPDEALDESVENFVTSLQQQHRFDFEKNLVPGQNWNSLWESNFEPVIVGDFCGIRADFHPPLQYVSHELVINPKMAFGTGHHETTFMVIEHMRNIDFCGKKVLDFGCGTGVLAILASKLGAKSIVAADIEEQSYRNTLENATNNGVANIEAVCGTLSDVSAGFFEVVLANINRHVILGALPTLSKRVLPGGWLVTSGYLLADEQVVTEALKNAGFQTVNILKQGNWISIKSRRD